jgi:DNA-binding NarL/FixJ family response regulator
VLKSTVDTELLNAIRVVAEGGAFLYPSGAKMLVEDYARLDTELAHADSQLSEREREVIRLITLGYTACEAAKVLALSPKTVETYRTRIMQKLGVHSRIGLVQYALLHDLLKEDLEEALS